MRKSIQKLTQMAAVGMSVHTISENEKIWIE